MDSSDTGLESEVLPESLSHLHALIWEGAGLNIATALLRMLGLFETERKVFISYRRAETAELANQLHKELVRRRFDVFLDRFSVGTGVSISNVAWMKSWETRRSCCCSKAIDCMNRSG